MKKVNIIFIAVLVAIAFVNFNCQQGTKRINTLQIIRRLLLMIQHIVYM